MNNDAKTTESDALSDKKKLICRKVINMICIVVCILLLPILVLNCTLIIKGMIKPDEVPSLGKYVPLIVLTQSMDPNIKAGDLIICKKVDASDVEVGDVISFFDPSPYSNDSTVVTHRVVDVEVDKWTGEISFWTQGDNNNKADGFAVPQENLVGEWTDFRLGTIGYVVMFMQSIWGILICIILPLAAVLLYVFLRRKNHDKAKQQDIDSLKAEIEALKAQKAEQERENAEQADPQPAENGD